MADEPTTEITTFERAIGPRGGLLAIDLGTKTLGLAASDTTRLIATPLRTISRTRFRDDCERLRHIMSERQTVGIVLGLPSNLDGTSGARVQSTRAYARNLANTLDLPVLMWDERLTTVEAERLLISADASRRRRAQVIDSVAAALILQGVLERLRRLTEHS